MLVRILDNCSAARMFYNEKDLHAKSELGRGHACGMKKDENECRDEYFGTLQKLWLVINKSTYLENIVLHLLAPSGALIAIPTY